MNPTMFAEFAAGLWATGTYLCLSFGAALTGLSLGMALRVGRGQ